MKTPHVWIVEVKFNGNKRWWPTVATGLNREDGRQKEAEWALRLPDDKTRLVKYERKDK